MQEEEQNTLQDIASLMTQHLGETWHTWDVQRALGEAGFVWKTVINLAVEASPEKQRLYRETCLMRGYIANNYVFVDEVGTDSRVINKRRGWVPKGDLSKSKTIFARGVRYTTIAAMCTEGLLATRTFEGASDKDTFMTFIIEEIVPRMNRFPDKKSVLVMDNCSIHDKDALSILGELHYFEVIFLPPYSPIFNPIENLFGTYKTWLRRHRDLVCQISPYDAIEMAMASITPAMCNNWIRAVSFYDRD